MGLALNKRLIENTQPHYGLIDGGVDDINFMDFDLRTAMDKPVTGRARRRKFNSFEFISVASPALILGVAIVDLRLVSNAFAYIYSPLTGQFQEFSFVQPLARNTLIEPLPKSGVARFRKGRNSLEIAADQAAGKRTLKLRLKGLEADVDIDEAHNYQPLGVCCRAGYSGWVYTQKAAGLPVGGQIRWQGQELDVAEQGALASVDWSAGFMRRETAWNWASLSCRLADGRRLGMNLAAGVNETGFSENALWLDGELITLAPVVFDFERYDDSRVWTMRSADLVVELQFQPRGKRCEKVNALLVASNFTQYFGQFSGELNLAGETIALDGQWGLCEDHYARW